MTHGKFRDIYFFGPLYHAFTLDGIENFVLAWPTLMLDYGGW
jgi:hypothetical protein